MATALEVHSHVHLADEASTLSYGAELARTLKAPAWVHLVGDLGAGKTTLARGLLSALGHDGHVRSPTYTLIESYDLESATVHHLDLYRLGSAEELFDLAVDDLSATPAIWLVEWPEKALEALPPYTHRVCLTDNGAGRDVELSHRRS